MATEELIVLLDARTAKLDAKLNSTNEKLDRLTESSKKSDGGLKKLGSGAKMAGSAILKTAAGAAALSAAISAIVISSASGRRELELLAKQAKTSTSDFQGLAFATSKYGINAEQIADISKDIADKVGEFSAAGTGAFQDYADVMKLSKDEARAAANEFEGLSSQEILGKMVSRMEDASVSGDKMTFVLESLGNDASRLIPLFKGNSSELLELKKRFNDVNDSLQITGTQAEALREVSNTFTLMTSSIGNATTAISATLAPVFDDFFNDIIDIVPDATQTIIDFVNSFLDAENITSIAGVNKEIETSLDRIAEKERLIATQKGHTKRVAEGHLEEENKRLSSLQDQLEVLQEQEKSLENATRLKGGEIGGEVAGAIGLGTGLGTGEEIQAIEDRFKLEETLLAEKLVRELQIIGDNNELKIQLEQEFADNIKSIRDESENESLKNLKAQSKELEKEDKQSNANKLNRQDSAVRAGMALNTLLFDDSKAISAGLIVADTATAIMRSLSINPYDYFNVGVIATTGAAQLANALSSSKGGGGTSAASVGSQPAQQQQPDFQPEPSLLELSGATEGGGQAINITVPDGDEIGQAIANWLTKAQKEGRA